MENFCQPLEFDRSGGAGKAFVKFGSLGKGLLERVLNRAFTVGKRINQKNSVGFLGAVM